MKTINQNKLDKAIHLILIYSMDFTTGGYITCLASNIIHEGFAIKFLPPILSILGCMPYLVVQHLDNFPKHIEKKLKSLFTFSICLLVVSISLTEFFSSRYDRVCEIFLVTASITFTLLAIAMIIKLFTSEENTKVT